MEYDKNSFLAGISVGRTLKGWASGNVGGTYGAAIVLQYGMVNVSPTQLSGYTSTIKLEEFNYGNLLVGPIKLTGED
mgnify:FL=1